MVFQKYLHPCALDEISLSIGRVNRVVGQVEVPAGQVNLRGSFPRSESDVLEPILHPAY